MVVNFIKIFVCFILSSIMMSNVTYAYEINDEYETTLSFKDNENKVTKSGDLLLKKQLSVESDFFAGEQFLDLYKCSDDIQDYVSVRNIIELIGGNITWDREENSEYNYGYIFVNNKKYKYIYSARGDYNLKTGFSFLSLYNIDAYRNEQPLHLNGNSTITLKLNENSLLMPVYQLIDLLNRWGYIYTIDKEEKVLKIKKHDFTGENELVNSFFPKTNDLFYYNSEETKYYENNLGEDFYTTMSSINAGVFNTIKKYFDTEYKHYIEVSDFEERARLCYKGYYYLDTANENITVEYNKDIDCYIAYNNRCLKENIYFKMIAIRRFDGQLIYAYE